MSGYYSEKYNRKQGLIMETEVLTTDVIDELQDEVLKVFPSKISTKIMINEEAGVPIFEVVLDEPDDKYKGDVFYWGTEALVDGMCLNRADIHQWLIEREKHIGSFVDIQSYLESIDFSSVASRYEIDRSIIERLHNHLRNNVEVTYTLSKTVDLMVKEEELLINRCIEKAGTLTLEEYGSQLNARLLFILDRAVYDPNRVGVYNYNDTKDISRMMKAIKEDSVAVQVLGQKQFIPIIQSFLKKLNRADLLEVPQLIRVFDDTFYESITGNLDYLTAFLEATRGQSGYVLKDGKYFIVSLEF